MKPAFLICPDQRPELSEILTELPLVLQPYLGKPLLDHALTGLVGLGYEKVMVYASDRPAQVREYVAHAAAWGMTIQVVSCAREKTKEQVRAECQLEDDRDVFLLDCLPQAPDVIILQNIMSWHQSRSVMMAKLLPNQIGVSEPSEGIWIGLKAKVAASAVIEPPVWIGHHVVVQEGAKIGPMACIESHSMIDRDAEVAHSTVNDRTYVGQMTNLQKSFAHGGELVNWTTGSKVKVVDHFLLSRLDVPRRSASGLWGRLAALLCMVLTSPVAFVAFLIGLRDGEPWLNVKTAVRMQAAGEEMQKVLYAEFPSRMGTWARWPRLWRVVMGDFCWVGNPPLSPIQASELTEEFERLWLYTAPAIFTAPEAEDSREPWDDEARMHAAMFASQSTPAWRRRILWKGILGLLSPHSSRS